MIPNNYIEKMLITSGSNMAGSRLVGAKKFDQLYDTLHMIGNRVDFYYRERPYHNVYHIKRMVDTIETITSNSDIELTVSDFSEIVFSILFHDVIYDVSKKDNEENSFEFAKNVLEALDVDEVTMLKIRCFIMATKHPLKKSDFSVNGKLNELVDGLLDHLSPTTLKWTLRKSMWIHDADLELLSVPYNEFIVNNNHIISEYEAYYDKETIRAGRIEFLKNIIKDPIYFSGEFATSNFSSNAINNIKRYLFELERHEPV